MREQTAVRAGGIALVGGALAFLGVFSFLAVVLIWLSGCGDGPQDPSLRRGEVREPALLAFYGDTTALLLATSARLGETIHLRFTTFLGGCMRRGATGIDIEGLEAHVRPSRLEPDELPANTACPAHLTLEENVVSLRFGTPGTALVRLEGWAEPEHRAFVLEREVEIVPREE